ncbi:hypothetical protein ACFLYJ_00545 [Candidatus Cloacimonadota bacterium]
MNKINCLPEVSKDFRRKFSNCGIYSPACEGSLGNPLALLHVRIEILPENDVKVTSERQKIYN